MTRERAKAVNKRLAKRGIPAEIVKVGRGFEVKITGLTADQAFGIKAAFENDWRTVTIEREGASVVSR